MCDAVLVNLMHCVADFLHVTEQRMFLFAFNRACRECAKSVLFVAQGASLFHRKRVRLLQQKIAALAPPPAVAPLIPTSWMLRGSSMVATYVGVIESERIVVPRATFLMFDIVRVQYLHVDGRYHTLPVERDALLIDAPQTGRLRIRVHFESIFVSPLSHHRTRAPDLFLCG
jgi:hypothetical protein